ncbi:hypothetical protein [Streptomyces barringtoniae]|uniref:hypothetical protein n=1 Tax=Streptomyces barringtoniae TaxID=2892029 RepID=UPI001E5C598A|nr:hypothetical protein [Streptomyces barringtoniae]MCC5477118.1 hypothetical protein [Streptomyces barringtoniae]
MQKVSRTDWDAAATRLLEDVYAFAVTGPRTHPDWQNDALAVLNRTAYDPRGWLTLDPDKAAEAEKSHGASFPFLTLSRGSLAERLFPITPETAARLLVTMTYEWGPIGREEDAQDRFDDAWTVLQRYGDNLECYSNITAARTSSSPDLTAGVTGWLPLTEYDGDFGIVVVSSAEVGVFWSFNPI